MTSRPDPQAFERLLGAERVGVRRDAAEGVALDGVSVAFEVRPGDPKQLAAVLELAGEQGVAVVPRGGATKLHLGNVCRADQVVLVDTGALAPSCEVDRDEGVAVVSAGMAVAEFAARCRQVDKRTLVPDHFLEASIGGSVAADPIAPWQTIGTRLRNDLLGLEVALADGTVARCGGRVVKNVTGFDLVRLHCGAMGTLGVLTEVALRLRPVPECARVWSRDVPDASRALELASELVSRGVGPAGVALLLSSASGREGARLLWQIEGAEVDVRERSARVEGDARDPADWEVVGARISAVDDAGEGGARVRISGRATDVGRILDIVARVGGASDAARIALPLVGTVWAALPAECVGTLLELCAASGLAAFVERASRATKDGIDVFGASPAGVKLQRAVKQRFDPRGTLSPGRFVGRI